MSSEFFVIKLADINIGIEPQSNQMRVFCKQYLCDEDADFVVSVSDKDIEAERKNMIDYTGREDASKLELEQLHIYRQIAENIPRYEAFLMHAVAIRLDEDAYLFAGASGSGKTTHAKLWKKAFGDRVCIINDDKPLLKISNNRIVAYGSPWSGKERLHNNIFAPVKAIVFINQAQENHIELMKKEKVWHQMMNQIYKSSDVDNMNRTLKFIDTIVKTVPIYSLYCNKSEQAVNTAYEALGR